MCSLQGLNDSVIYSFQATTDLYGNCTLRHSGTSAAAPEAAGVFALAIEAKYVSYCPVHTSICDVCFRWDACMEEVLVRRYNWNNKILDTELE